MTTPETLTLICYFFVLSILGIYGWHRYYIVYQYMKHKDRVPGPPPPVDRVAGRHGPAADLQRDVRRRSADRRRLRDRLSDATSSRFRCSTTRPTRRARSRELAVRRQAARGFDIKYLHRDEPRRLQGRRARGGAGRGARRVRRDLRRGLRAAVRLPARRRSRTSTTSRVAVVQARWGHLNQSYSLLTNVQAILLDGHFVLEHGGRNRSGCFFNFNGTAGVWRREAIADAGGWQHDTLTEDLDLSYRAQLRGWQFLFLPDLVTPAEVPVEMNAFKSQQHRWAKGSIQTCRKLLPYILLADLPLKVKVEAFFHLTANFNYLLMVVLSVLMFPAMVVRYEMGWTEMLLIDIPLFVAATLSVFNFYLISQREVYPDWATRAQLSAGRHGDRHRPGREQLARPCSRRCFGKPSEFTRTPKYGIERRQDDWQHKKYHQSMPIQPFVEAGARPVLHRRRSSTRSRNDIYGTLPFLMLFQFGFLYMGLMSIFQQTGGDDVLVKAPDRRGK